MILAGNTVYLQWGYRPETIPAITWQQLANGNWRGSDRGTSEDKYISDITFRGPLSELTDLESALDSNRNYLECQCGVGEEILTVNWDWDIMWT